MVHTERLQSGLLRPVDVKNLAASREQPVSALANPRGGYKATLPVMLHCQEDQDL